MTSEQKELLIQAQENSIFTQSPVTSPLLTTSDLTSLCEALLRADPDIRDIVVFGSAAYVPDLALDIDLLVITNLKKDEDVYFGAITNWPTNVDILVKEPGETMSYDIALSVCANRCVLYGNGNIIEEVWTTMPIPTYQDAYDFLRIGDDDLKLAQSAEEASIKDKRLRLAFDALFHGTRHAVMTFLCTDNQRWGELRRALPDPFAERFREMINTLHILYAYDGKYPQDCADEEFHHWRDMVERFIQDLESAGSPAPQISDSDAP